MAFIYKTTNIINNKIYVGKHKHDNNHKYLGSGNLLKDAIKKYGVKNFKREILEHVTDENINQREIYWIRELQSQNLEIGYNISSGGDGGNIAPWTEERKLKIKNGKKGQNTGKNNPNYGNKWDDAQRKRQSEKFKGRKSWNKGLDQTDLRVKINSDRRKQTMDENDIWKKGKEHHWFNIRRNGDKNGKWINVNITMIIQDFKNGMSLTQLSKKYNISRDTVRSRLKDNLKSDYVLYVKKSNK